MTHSHAVVPEEVMAYLDGELAPARAGDVSQHVASCDECRGLVEEFRTLSTRLHAWRLDAPPARLNAGTWGAAVDSASRRVSWSSWLKGRGLVGLPRWALGAVPVLAVLVVVVSLSPKAMSDSPAINYSFSHDRAAVSAPGEALHSEAMGAQGYTGEPLVSGSAVPLTEPVPVPQAFSPEGPMIARTATIRLVTDKFDGMRAALEQLTAVVEGSIASFNVTGEPSNRRAIRAVLRVPASRLDGALTEIRRLGRVREESLASEDIGDAHRDLVVRLANARREEARLNELLSRRTDRLADVLAVEREVSRVRGEVERMESEALSMRTRVRLSTVSVQVDETYQAELALDAPPLSTRLRNAVIDGWRDAAEGLVSALLLVLRTGPTWLVWIGILALPAWWLSKRTRRVRPAGSSGAGPR
jgi:hypothetical protein